jgi:hypothetical protein
MNRQGDVRMRLAIAGVGILRAELERRMNGHAASWDTSSRAKSWRTCMRTAMCSSTPTLASRRIRRGMGRISRCAVQTSASSRFGVRCWIAVGPLPRGRGSESDTEPRA